jgi:hypothetical protein
MPGRFRTRGLGGPSRYPEYTVPDLTIRFEGTLALVA